MDEQHLEEILYALEAYFDQADPQDEAGNLRLAASLLARYRVEALFLAPAVIQQGLRHAVEYQMPQALGGMDEGLLDRQIRALGLALLIEYTHLLKAAGESAVFSLLPTLSILRQDRAEDAIALIALAAALLWHRSPSVWFSVTLKGSADLLEDEFRRVGNTSCKIALAYLLFLLEERQPFLTYAVPRLAEPAAQGRLKALLSPKSQELLAWVLGVVIMDIASDGRAIAPEMNWQRPNR